MGSAILRRAFTYTCTFSWNGEMRGVRWRALSPWAHNAGAANKTRGLPGRMIGVNPFAGPPSQGAVSGTGQALQGDTLPAAA
jgi:hypothetical protein